VTTELDAAFVDRWTAAEHVPAQIDGRATVIDQVVGEAVAQFSAEGGVSVDVVYARKLVETGWIQFDQASVRTFVPVLVRHAG
jgi:hypothetical protein